MNTRVCLPDEAGISEAAELLRQGSLVGFPTETVYGLGADALNANAVRSIFEAKGRPADNPLIVHIWNRDQLLPLCHIPPKAIPLMDAFWPGPLTILFPRKSTVPDIVTAGLPTVAIRMPSHPVASQLLQVSGVPIAAPSANRSGKPSPTTSNHVYQDMNGRIPLIIDGGSCDVGVESTVVDVTHGQPIILRPGGITKEMLEKVLDEEVLLAGSILRPLKPDEKALSPGMRYKHYAPAGTVTLVSGPEQKVLQEMKNLVTQDRQNGMKACVMCFTEHMDFLKDCNPHDLGSVYSDTEIAHRLFNTLRQMDDEEMDCIYSEVVLPEGVGLAVMNRLGRAAAFRVVEV